MAGTAAQYLRRRRAAEEEAKLLEAAEFAAVMLNADPANPRLDYELTNAAEALLRVRERIEYIDALIDERRSPRFRKRPPGSPTPVELLLIQQKAQADRRAAHRVRRGYAPDASPAVPRVSEPIIVPILTFEQAQAQSDERQRKAAEKARAKAEKSARLKAARKIKAAAHARQMRALKKQQTAPSTPSI